MPKAGTKKKQHYVDNKKFLEAIIKYKEKVDIAKRKVSLNLASMTTLVVVF